MKCGIVTVYNSENCGSFLQAYALSRTLQKKNHEVVFIRQNFKDHSVSPRNRLKMLVKTALRGNFSGVKRLKQKHFAFMDACKKLKIVDKYDDVSCFILGSDVIWDITVPFFLNHYPFFWGTQFKNKKTISYAASLGSADETDVKNTSFIPIALNNINTISVRDETSRRSLKPFCKKEIQVVCDPTYLLNKKEYDDIAKPLDLSDFIFLYYYGNVEKDYEAIIKLIAQKESLKIVTFGNGNQWCDINLAYDPLLFLSIYDKAKYIITNTFHGTVFATIYEKKFVVIKNEKTKIIDVLKMCGLSNKMTQTSDDIISILHSDFDYETTRCNIEAERKKAFLFINEALMGSDTNGKI